MADDNKFEIKYTVDDTDAKAKAAASGKRLDDVAAKADRAAKKMASGMAASAASQAAAIGKVDQAARKLGDSHVAAARKAAAAHAKAAAEIGQSWDVAGASQAKFLEGFKGFVATNLGFGGLVGGLREVAAALAEGNKQIDDYAKNLIKVKDDLKELATLKGLVSADDKFIKGIADFGRATGLTITESDQYQRQYLGSLAAGEAKGNISADTTEDLMVQGARVASRQTHDLSTRGDLLGVISQFARLDPSAKGGVKGRAGTEMALGQAEAIRQALTEGRGDDGPLTQSLLKVAGSFVGDKGPVPTLPEMAAVVGVTSLSAGAGQADSRAEALIRALRGSTPEQVAFLRSQGVKETDTFQQKFNTLAPKLMAQQAAGRDLGTYLMESGFNDEQARALSENVPLAGVLNQRMAAARNARSGADLIAESDRLAESDPNQRQRLADAELTAAKLARGAERQDIQPDVTKGMASLVSRKADTDPLAKLGDVARSAGTFFQVPGLDIRAKQEAVEKLRKEAGRGESFGESAARVLFGDVGVAAHQGLTSITGGQDREIQELKAAIEAQTQAIKDQTRTLAGAIGQQTKQLTPGRPVAAPLPPARPGPGVTR